tara:strand:+ start:7448 stop:7672 length:225 start_codon:yes stop_codon:yes gene_type:complete
MSYKLSDNVLRRIVQIVQEGFLTGTDVADHMRMIKLDVDENNSSQLVLTEEYKTLVEGQHESMLSEIEEIKVSE